MSKLSHFGQALYEGTVSIDFVGRKWLWYALSGVVLLVAVLGLTVKQLNMGIEFTGGVEYRISLPAGQADQDAVTDVRGAVAGSGIDAASSPIVNTSGSDNIRVQTEPLTNDQTIAISERIQDAIDVGPDDISQDAIGPSWGQQVGQRALIGLGVFLVLVMLLIWGYFREWKMSVAAIVALMHDLIITIGVYALSGFEVTPATVTGVLTILGFSLYDTVVVFDKVRENTKNLARTRKTYAEAANLAVNQTLVRSINTSIVALLPVGALLYVGTVQLGSGALKDLALALFVGMAAGVYSSVFIATPLLVQLKERETGVRAGDARARRHRAKREADPFANVPVFTEDMPIRDSEAGLDEGFEEDPDDLDDPRDGGRRTGATALGAGGGPGGGTGGRSAAASAPTRVTAGERPPTARPVSESTSAGRPQPTRKPRSQRGGSGRGKG
ncbi:MAG: Protein translocase subunit SecF [uncultured Nocardioidaceae bacterium]|uniref:Protein-export membrane protein SecF n=1 Tax=uncultured Nocardioidaceae bacterium TaxID=253824 RepID=A0A6J4M7A6_9ACTN|nr:MAG: Protein translocase subunit SecF [uncultured Nocardioidaceae bacterium]